MAEYIEREALIADIDAAMDNAGMGRVVGQTLKRYVKRQPVADVALVVRAKWKLVGQVCVDGEYVDCYRCGKCSIPYDKKSRFCPNCGADMREG